jgi:hypothetical protein
MIVIHRDGFTNFESMCDTLILSEFIGDGRKHRIHTKATSIGVTFCLKAHINTVKHTISKKFNDFTWNRLLIQLMQLCLTLVKFIDITLMKSVSQKHIFLSDVFDKKKSRNLLILMQFLHGFHRLEL